MPCVAENMPYFSKDMDLCIAYNMEEGTMKSIQFEYLNFIAAYMLHALAPSLRAWVNFCMPSRMSGTWINSWRKTHVRLTGIR